MISDSPNHLNPTLYLIVFKQVGFVLTAIHESTSLLGTRQIVEFA